MLVKGTKLQKNGFYFIYLWFIMGLNALIAGDSFITGWFAGHLEARKYLQ
jgi:hypothetical protein